jgi:hypothetical protein
VRRLIAPRDNERDLPKLPANVRRDIEIIFVSNMDQVIAESILLDDRQVENLGDSAEVIPEPVAQEEQLTDLVATPEARYDDGVTVDADSTS